MTYWDHVRAQARGAWLFFAIFVALGVLLDLFVFDRAVGWGFRLGNGALVTVLYVLFAAWLQHRKAA